MDNRPVLLSSVLLRQNPHNVNEWRKRVKLFEGKPREVSVTLLVEYCTLWKKIVYCIRICIMFDPWFYFTR